MNIISRVSNICILVIINNVNRNNFNHTLV